MRTDEAGHPCPSTLGEYRDLCAAIAAAECPAVQFLDERIAGSERGRDEEVGASDHQMWLLLMPMLMPKDRVENDVE